MPGDTFVCWAAAVHHWTPDVVRRMQTRDLMMLYRSWEKGMGAK